MTKFKEYLRAKGIKLECDYEFLPCGYIECVETRVLDNYIIVAMFSNCAGWEYAVFNKHGVCDWFDEDDRQTYISGPHCDPEYIDFLLDMGYDNSEAARAIMRYTYANDVKTRIAFKHMRAGIMDKEVFRKWHLKRCLEYVGIS